MSDARARKDKELVDVQPIRRGDLRLVPGDIELRGLGEGDSQAGL